MLTNGGPALAAAVTASLLLVALPGLAAADRFACRQMHMGTITHIALHGVADIDVVPGPLTRLRKECLPTRKLPTGLDLGKAQQRCGWRHLRIDEPRSSVELLADNRVLRIGTLRSASIDSALVEAGGDMA